MRTVQATEFKHQLAQLLDAVEGGEVIVVTRHGRPIARIIPEAQGWQERSEQAAEEIREIRKRTGGLPEEAIKETRRERNEQS